MTLAPALAALALALAQPGFIGAKVTENADTLEEVGSHRGVKVLAVVENSPAAAIGLRPGDVILTLAGAPIDWPDAWTRAEAGAKPGEELPLEIRRDDEVLALALVPVARVGPPPPAPPAETLVEDRRAGVTLRTLADAERGRGVLIAELRPDSPWRAAGVQSGDVLAAIDGQTVHAPRQVLNRIQGAPEGARWKLRLVRAGNPLVAGVRLSAREKRLSSFYVPFLVHYEEDREFSCLFHLVKTTRQGDARTWRFLFLFRFTIGERDVIREVK